MAPPSSQRKRHKQRMTRATPAKHPAAIRRKARTAKTTSLDVQRDPTRKQEVQRKRREKSPGRKTMPAFTNLELPELINRSIKAFMELQLRIVRARTPFEVWRHQHQFAQEIISDWQLATFRVMRASLSALPSR